MEEMASQALLGLVEVVERVDQCILPFPGVFLALERSRQKEEPVVGMERVVMVLEAVAEAVDELLFMVHFHQDLVMGHSLL
jgi:hypothetical protein